MKNFFRSGKILIILFGIGVMTLTGYFSSQTQPFQIASLLGPSHPIRIAYEAYLDKFDDEKLIYLLLKRKEAAFQQTEMNNILRYSQKNIERLRGIQGVQSLESAEYLTYKDGHMALRPFIKNGVISAQAANALEEDFWSNTLINQDKNALILALTLGEGVSGDLEKSLMKKLMEFQKNLENDFSFIESHFIGTKIAKYHFLKEMQLTQTVVMPLLLLLLGLLILYLFRSPSVLFWIFFIMMQSYAMTLCLVIFNEGGMGPYNGLALFFVLIVATSDLIHYFSAVADYPDESFEKRLELAKRKVFMPCLLTTLTTIIGFVSLILNEMAPVSYFGIYCAFGSLICFLLTFYLLPKILLIFKNETRLPTRMQLFPSKGLLEFVFKKPVFIIMSFVIIGSILAFFSTRVQINDDFYDKFYADHPLSRSVKAFNENFKFVGSIDLLIKSSEPVLSQKTQGLFKELEKEILEVPNVSYTKSFYGLLDHIERAVEKGARNESSEERFKIVESIYHLMNNFGFLESFLYKKTNELKLSIFLDSLSSKELREIIAIINEITRKEKYRENLETELMGFATIRTTLYEGIIVNFIKSFGLSFVIIFVLFLILFRSLKWAAMAMLPNIIPLLFISGVIGMLGISVENNLVLMVCITLGIAVDDTIHFLYSLKREVGNGQPFKDAVRKAFDQTSKALLGTTLVFILSFPCFFLADLKLFIQVGFFVMASLLLALMSDFILLPALFIVTDKDS